MEHKRIHNDGESSQMGSENHGLQRPLKRLNFTAPRRTVTPKSGHSGRPRKYLPSVASEASLLPEGISHNNTPNITVGALPPTSSMVSVAPPPTRAARVRASTNGGPISCALSLVGGADFRPYILHFSAGQDVVQELRSMTFGRKGPRFVNVMSGNGQVSTVSLLVNKGEVMNYEGRFEIVSLSGFISAPPREGSVVKPAVNCGLSAVLAGPDCRIIDGKVTGGLIAASAVQIVVGTFSQDQRRGAATSRPAATAETGNFQRLPRSGTEEERQPQGPPLTVGNWPGAENHPYLGLALNAGPGDSDDEVTL